jgi:DNA mismatch repair protein MutS2
LANRARRYLGRDRVEAEAATQRLEETQRELQEQTEETQSVRDEVLRLQRDYEHKLQRLQEQRDAEVEKAREEARHLVHQTQQEADAILRELRGAGRESKQTEVARGRLRTLRERVAADSRVAEDRRRGGEKQFATTDIPLDVARLQAGNTVRVRSLKKEGVLLSAPNEKRRVEVRVGSLRVEAGLDDVEPLQNQGESTPAYVTSMRLQKALSVPDEINLIGQTTDRALPALEKYLDDALLGDLDVIRIVHGRGTGALRKAIHEFLKRHRSVREFHLAPPNEGGEGATIVNL